MTLWNVEPQQIRRDFLFDEVCAQVGIAVPELTDAGRGALNRALKELRQVGATPDQVGARARAFRRRWPNVTLTPTALAKHWASLLPPPVQDGRMPVLVERCSGCGRLSLDCVCGAETMELG